MKKNFKKVLSVLLTALMLCSVFSVGALAAGPYRITLTGGYRSLNSTKLYGEFIDEYADIVGTKKTVQADEYVFMYKAGGGAASQLPEGSEYYEFTQTIDGVDYTFTYTINEETGEKENQAVVFYTDANGNLTYPIQFFKMKGHVTYSKNGVVGRWSTSTTANGSGTLTPGTTKKVTKATVYGCYYTQDKYTVQFLPGVDGEGSVQTQKNVTYNRKITLKDAIFTRSGYVQIGWALTENSAKVEYELSQNQVPVTGNIDFYPVWQKMSYELDYDVDALIYETVCEDYSAQPTQNFEIKNNSNTEVKLTLPTSAAFKVTANGSLTIPADGGIVEISVQPKEGLAVGTYAETLKFDFGIEDINFTVKASFAVLKHRFENYKSNDDATYEADGTKTATCIFGCGTENTIEDEGSKRVYSVTNNTVKGLLKEYLYHKTVNCVAYGSGSDYTEDEIVNAITAGKDLYRFRPVSWYVNEEHNGEFAEGNYIINYVHTDFGSYSLTVKYVEEKLVDGEWVATEVEDEKSFKYSIGPSAKDEQEVVRPNMIVNIIFALMGYLMDVVGGLLG